MPGDVHLEVGGRRAAPALQLVVVDFRIGRREIAERGVGRDACGAAVVPLAAVLIGIALLLNLVIFQLLVFR